MRLRGFRVRLLLIACTLPPLGAAACSVHVFQLDSTVGELEAPPPGQRPAVGLTFKRVVTLDGEPFDSDPEWVESVRARTLDRLRSHLLFSRIEESFTPQEVDLLLHVETAVHMDDPPWLYGLISRASACGLPGWRSRRVEQELSVLTPAFELRFFHRQQVSLTSFCSWFPASVFLPPYTDYRERFLVLTDRLLDIAIHEAAVAGAFRSIAGAPGRRG